MNNYKKIISLHGGPPLKHARDIFPKNAFLGGDKFFQAKNLYGDYSKLEDYLSEQVKVGKEFRKW